MVFNSSELEAIKDLVSIYKSEYLKPTSIFNEKKIIFINVPSITKPFKQYYNDLKNVINIIEFNKLFKTKYQKDIMLHSRSIIFKDMNSKLIKINSDIPSKFNELF